MNEGSKAGPLAIQKRSYIGALKGKPAESLMSRQQDALKPEAYGHVLSRGIQ